LRLRQGNTGVRLSDRHFEAGAVERRERLVGANDGIVIGVSGRGRRPLKGLPPPAAQTARAVFPQAAFMNGLSRTEVKGSVRQGELA
jgi:hypothetical protein